MEWLWCGTYYIIAMKNNLNDTTFIIAVRLDSIQRLENTLAVTKQIYKYFNTSVLVAEIAEYCNGVLRSLLPRNVEYVFIEDTDSVFYRTKYFNQLLLEITTPVVGLWDTDVVIDKKAILEAVDCIRTRNADIVYPYNGTFLETSEIIRKYYLKTKDIRVLYRNISKLELLYNQSMVGGAFFADRVKYINAGMENERHYGWGNEDYDRFYRFVGLNYKIRRINAPLFHLCHPRGINSQYRSKILEQISTDEKSMIESCSKDEIEFHIANNMNK